MSILAADHDPENTQFGCFVCDLWFGIGEPALVKLAEHKRTPDHLERVRDWRYGAARRMGAGQEVEQ